MTFKFTGEGESNLGSWGLLFSTMTILFVGDSLNHIPWLQNIYLGETAIFFVSTVIPILLQALIIYFMGHLISRLFRK